MEARTFRLQKWYFDIALSTGEIIFFFLARTRIFGWKDERLSLTVVAPGREPFQRSLLLRESDIRALPALGAPGAEAEIGVRISGGDLALDLVFSRHPDDRPSVRPMVIPRGKRRILWEPVHGRSLVRGSVRVENRIWDVPGTDGYIDRLDSDIFPLFTPLRTLYWGRFHHSAGSLIYTVVQGPSSQAWMAWISRSGRLDFDAVEIVETRGGTSKILGLRYPTAYALTAQTEAGRIHLDVENTVAAVETAFVGNEKLPRAEGLAIDLIGRRPRGIKFFSRGRARIEDGSRTLTIDGGTFFSEIVRFS